MVKLSQRSTPALYATHKSALFDTLSSHGNDRVCKGEGVFLFVLFVSEAMFVHLLIMVKRASDGY